MSKLLRIVGVFGFSLIIFLTFAATAGIIRVQGARTEPVLDTSGRNPSQISDLTGEVETELSPDPETAHSPAAPAVDVDLQASLTDFPDPVKAGGVLTYTVGILNSSPQTATLVTLTDTLPVELTLIAAIPSQGTCTGPVCDLGTLLGGNSANVTLTASVDPSFSGTMTNTVEVWSFENELLPGDNTATEPTTVTMEADLSIIKLDVPDPVNPGGTLTYTLSVGNSGPSNANGVVVTDTLPAEVSLSSITPSQGSCAGTVCTLGTISPTGSASVTLVGTVNLTATGSFTNTAEVKGLEPDPLPGNNTHDEVTSISTADLAVLMSGTPIAVTAGNFLTYTVTITNLGTSDATNVVLTDTLPGEVTFVSSTPGAPACTPAPGSLTCTWSILPSGGVLGVTILVQVDPGAVGPLTNTADVSSDAFDPDNSNNQAQVITPVQQSADLWLVKSDDPDPVFAGNPLTYTLTITNLGPSDAIGVMVNDNFPTNILNFIAAPPNCIRAGPNIDCQLGDMGAGMSIQVILLMSVKSSANNPLNNTATVSSTTTLDPNPTNNQVTENTTIDFSADLSVSTVDNPDPVTPGDTITYTLTVANNGPSTANGVVVTDTLPAEVSLSSIAPSQGSCAGTICTLGSIAAAGSANVTLVGTVDLTATGSFTNTAEVKGLEPDPLPGNNTDDEVTSIGSADLAVLKSGTPIAVTAGNFLTYTVTITNLGTSDATNVVLTDTLPGEVTFVSSTPGAPACTPAPGSLTCTWSILPSGGVLGVTILVQVDPGAVGPLTNTADVSSDAFDPDTSNNQAQVITPVQQSADLSVSTVDNPDPVPPGGTLTYTLTVANSGPSDASGVVVTDTLPAEVSLSLIAPSQGSCAGTVCTLGTISPTGSASVTLVGTVNLTATGSFTNTAEVKGLEPDPLPGNNTHDEVTSISTADLAVLMSGTPITVTAGNFLTYTVTITNLGTSDATNVVLTDTLPGEVTFVSSTPGAPACTPAPGSLTCTWSTLPSGGVLGVTILVQVDPGAVGPLTNTADVSSDAFDPDTSNNQAQVITPVQQSADLSVSTVDNPDPVPPGGTLTYTLTVANSGPSDANGVVVTDTLPAEVSFVSSTPVCNESAGIVTCGLGTLAVSGSANVTLVGTVDLTATGSFTNTAEVAGLQLDPLPGNNTDDEVTSIGAADLAVIKSGTPITVTAGNYLTYTVTITNLGASDAPNVLLADTLPAEVTFVSSQPGAPVCNESAGVVTCGLGTLTATGSISVTLVTAVDVAATGSLTNTADVSSNAFDPDTSNNQATVITPVQQSADLSVSMVDFPDPVSDGGVLTYTLTVANSGPSNARDVLITDTLPAEATFVSSTPGSPTCSESNGQVICDLGDLVSSAAVSVTIVTSVDVISPTVITNTATAASMEPDPQMINNTAEVTTTVSAGANLALIKDSAPDPVVAGETLTYSLTVNNIGPLDADSVLLVDTLPPLVNFVSSTPGAPACSESNGQVSCDLGNLPRDESAQVRITVQVDPSTLNSLTNQAVVSSLTYDPDETDNQTVETTQVETSADLNLSILDDPDPVSPGGILHYTINFNNNGPSVSRDVGMTIQLPISATLNSITPSNLCSLSQGNVECSFGDVLSGAGFQVSLLLTVNSDASGTLSLLAVLSTNTGDPDGSNNSASETTSVFVPDTEAPKVTWVSPVGNEQRFDVGTEIIQLEVYASDNVGVQKVIFYWWDYKIKQQDKRVNIGSVSEAPYRIDFDTSLLYYGYNHIYVTAYDMSENASEWGPYIFLYRYDYKYLPIIAR